MASRAGVALDVDGTLVDSTFHHALCWQRAFAQHGLDVTAAVAHAHVGMGGDQLVQAIAGEQVERELGDALRAAHDTLFAVELPTVRPIPGARELLCALSSQGAPVVLASSAGTDEVVHYLRLLDAGDLVDGWTTSDDVARTKPHADLVEVARGKLDTPTAIMIGDSPWDVRAAAAADVPTVAVDTGGFGRAALEDAGAALVVDSLGELIDHLGGQPFVDWGPPAPPAQSPPAPHARPTTATR